MGLLKILKKWFSNKKETKEELKLNTTNIDVDVKKENNINNFDENKNITKNDSVNYVDEYIKSTSNKQINENKNKIKLDHYFQNNQIKTVDLENKTNLISNIWDYIKIKENTQAEHLIKSIPFDKWITMDEIRHNIKLNFNVEYSNEKSLYPYLKTLTDTNLIKLNNTGKKRTWKKNIILVK